MYSGRPDSRRFYRNHTCDRLDRRVILGAASVAAISTMFSNSRASVGRGGMHTAGRSDSIDLNTEHIRKFYERARFQRKDRDGRIALLRRRADRPLRLQVRISETPQIDRRSFLRNSGLMISGLAAAPAGLVRPASAQSQTAAPGFERKKTVCPFCVVGCSIWAEVENGAWIGQEPAVESPVNMGAHCAKGAATRELGLGERRLKYPTKLENGEWRRVSWEQAIDEIGGRMLDIREESGPDSVYWLGSAKFSNEAAYLFRKFAAPWGANNVDHQSIGSIIGIAPML